jgi:hypothetical protein
MLDFVKLRETLKKPDGSITPQDIEQLKAHYETWKFVNQGKSALGVLDSDEWANTKFEHYDDIYRKIIAHDANYPR